MVGHQRGVGVGHDVAQHGVGADEIELVVGDGHAHRRAILDDRLGRILGEPFRHAVEVDLAVERRQERLLRGDPGTNLFESGGHGMAIYVIIAQVRTRLRPAPAGSLEPSPPND